MSYLYKIRTHIPTDISTAHYYMVSIWGDKLRDWFIPFTDNNKVMKNLEKRLCDYEDDDQSLRYSAHNTSEPTFEVPDEYIEWLSNESDAEVLAKAVYNLAVNQDIMDSIEDFEKYNATQELLYESRVSD